MSLDLVRVVGILSSGTYESGFTSDGHPTLSFSSYYPPGAVRAAVSQAIGVSARAALAIQNEDGALEYLVRLQIAPRPNRKPPAETNVA